MELSEDSRKWLVLVATIWVQAVTGTNFDFSAYSSQLKAVLSISQVQLNYLAVASDLGKVFGWSSGIALLYLPLWAVLLIAALMGLVGYGLQYLAILSFISLPYSAVFLLCLLAGCSICWFNTVCFVLCIRSFSTNRALALSLTVSFNGLSAAFYALAVNSFSPAAPTSYLLLNALLPLLVSLAALGPILLARVPAADCLPSSSAHRDSLTFLLLNLLALLTSFFLLALRSSTTLSAGYLLLAVFLLVFPMIIVPGIASASTKWAADRSICSSFHLQGCSSGFNLVDVNDLELYKDVLLPSEKQMEAGLTQKLLEDGRKPDEAVLGEEHTVKMLLGRLDFWLYYLSYFCGATLGLVYSNNLGQISQSVGASSKTASLVSLYSASSFFGRILSAAPDFLRSKLYFGRPGWLAIALAPTPVALFTLAYMDSNKVLLEASTSLIGLSSGFIFGAAVSVTSEIFGPKSFGVNHNIVVTNIPVGSLVYCSLAALVYDRHGMATLEGMGTAGEAIVCMGSQCYKETFLLWGCISVVGLICSGVLFLHTRAAYNRFESNRTTMLF